MVRVGLLVVLLGVGVAFGGKAPIEAPKPARGASVAGCAECRFLAHRPARSAIRLVQNGPSFLAPPETPQPLPPAEDASLLPPPGSNTELNALLDRYLPNASADERSVWADELRQLPTEMARDLLAARSQFGEPRSLFEPPTTGLVPPPSELKDVTPPVRAPRSVGLDPRDVTLSTLRQIEAIHRHNIANAGTVGFKRLRGVTLEAAEHGGVDGLTLQHVEAQGELEETGRSLDLAIEGDGYFQVRGGDAVALTRRGTFMVSPIGELALKVGDSMWSLYPTMTVPKEVTSIHVHENGAVSAVLPGENEIALGQIELVRAADSSVLESAGGGLLAVPELAGVVTTGRPGDEPFGLVRQGCLEGSNVDLTVEVAALERLRTQIAALEAIDLPRMYSPMASGQKSEKR